MTPNEIDDLERDAKAAATLIAKLALAGHTVHQDRSGGFLVTRWGVSRFCMDLESLQDFARQVGIHS